MSVTIEKSEKWAQSEQTVGNNPTEEDARPYRLRESVLSLQNRHPDGTFPSSVSQNPLNSEAASRSEDAMGVPQRNAPSAAFPSVPPPPSLIPPTREKGYPEASDGIPLQPVWRPSQTDDAAPRQFQIGTPSSSTGTQPVIPLQQFAPALPPPPQPHFVPPAAFPYSFSQPMGRYIYSGTPSGPSTPYQGMLPGTPQVFASPAPMSTYIPSPGPAILSMSGQSPATYPGGSVTAVPFPPPQLVATSPAYLPGTQSAPQSTRPLTNASMTTSQSVYGGPSQTYPSQSMPARSQSTYGPSSQQPVIPGAPVIPAFLPARTPTRRASDAFIANDPFKASSHGKHDKKDDGVTFDDIPVAGQPGSVQGSTMPASTPYYSTPSSVPYYRPFSQQIPGWRTPSQQQPPPSSVSRPSQGANYDTDPVQPVTQPPFTPGGWGTSDQGTGGWGTSGQETGGWGTGGWGTVDHSSPGNGGYSVPQDSNPWVRRPSSSSEDAKTSSPIPTPPIHDQGPPHEHVDEPITLPSPESISEESKNYERPPDDTQAPPRPPSPGGQQSPTYAHYDPYRPSSPYDPAAAYGSYPYSPPHIPLDPMLSLPYYGYQQPYRFPPPKESFWSRVGRMVVLPFWRPRLAHKPPTSYMQSAESAASDKGVPQIVITFIVSTLPSQIYLHILLRLPSLYFSRVARIFEEADLTLPEIKKMALETASQGKRNLFDFQVFELQNVPPQYERLKSTWEAFIDSVMREWKTFNIISVLLLSAILTILQIQSAASDPITRYTALFSLICALMSLLFGCMYIIRFGSMRKTYKAAEWALEAKKTKTIWWNVWVLLAMPAIWLTWSIVLYIACIMSFIWRTSPLNQSPTFNVSHRSIQIIRIVITAVLGIGIIYGWLILSTFRRYGTVMDKAWKKRIDGWIDEKAQMQSSTPYPYSTPYYDPTTYPSQSAPYPFIPPPGTPIPPYADYSQGYLDPKPGYGFSGPTYPSASYVPPPEPYDSPENSEEDSATNNVTQSNTLYNKLPEVLQPGDNTSSFVVHDRPGPSNETPPPPPLPLKIPLSPGDTSIMGASTKVPLAVPPPPSLPTIPGTPATPFVRPSSFRNSYSTGHRPGSALGLNLNGEAEGEASHEYHVRFRSPLLSAQPSVFAGSDVDETPQSGDISPGSGYGSGISTHRVPLASNLPGPGQDSESSESP